MGISYNKLFKLLIDKKIKKTELANRINISPGTLAKLSKDEFVSMEVLVKICEELQCNIGDVVDIVDIVCEQ